MQRTKNTKIIKGILKLEIGDWRLEIGKLVYGFSLIELLVVISIIGILATLLLANYNATRSRSRDSQRKSDTKNLQTALRIYYNDFNSYPTSTDGKINGCVDGDTTCEWGSSFSTSSQTYMSIMPKDPSADRQYVYTYLDDDSYELQACLENTSDEKCGTTCGSEFSPTGESVAGCVYTVKP